MLTPCIGCGERIRAGTGGRCRKCRAAHRRYRSGSAWRRQSLAARAGGRCARCGATGVQLHAHHAVPLARDLERGVSGAVEPLCVACHTDEHSPRPDDRPLGQR